VFEDCCGFFEHFIKYVFGNEGCMNDEIIESIYEYSAQQRIVVPPLFEDEANQ
jgi:hypothetical protein